MDSVQSVSFVDAVKLYFVRAFDFQGRSRRSEYWWIYLFNMIVGTIITGILAEISWIWTVATLVPTLSLCIRRLHDVGKSGWWYLLIFVPLVGPILLIIWFCRDSDPDNQWGPNPKIQPGSRYTYN